METTLFKCVPTLITERPRRSDDVTCKRSTAVSQVMFTSSHHVKQNIT